MKSIPFLLHDYTATIEIIDKKGGSEAVIRIPLGFVPDKEKIAISEDVIRRLKC